MFKEKTTVKKLTYASLHVYTHRGCVVLGGLWGGRADKAAVADPQYTWDLTEFYPSKAAGQPSSSASVAR